MHAADAPSTRPVLASFAGYRPGWLKGDVAAGLAIAAVGLPTRHRLPGDRRPAAADRPLRLDRAARRLRGLRPLAPAHRRPRRRDDHRAWPPSSPPIPDLAAADRPGVAAMFALIVGVFYLGGRPLGLGVLSTFLSRPILVGFFAGISLSIITGQLKRVTGAPIAPTA